MKTYEATEQAYKNGYDKGFEDGKPKWIPATERLPEKSGSYLVCSDREAVYETHFHTKKHFQNGYMREAGFTQRGKTIITHWMPLPEPPKGE